MADSRNPATVLGGMIRDIAAATGRELVPDFDEQIRAAERYCAESGPIRSEADMLAAANEEEAAVRLSVEREVSRPTPKRRAKWGDRYED